jgi:hypothetical protein
MVEPTPGANLIARSRKLGSAAAYHHHSTQPLSTPMTAENNREWTPVAANKRNLNCGLVSFLAFFAFAGGYAALCSFAAILFVPPCLL